MKKQFAVGSLILSLCLLAVYFGNQDKTQLNSFEQWKIDYGIKYADEKENAYRRMIFEKNMAKIKAHNADPTQTYKMGINQFVGITQEQFINTYLNSNPPKESVSIQNPEQNYHPIIQDFDWTTQGKVSKVKNQGQCGSSYAFAVTGAIESCFAISQNYFYQLSNQQLVDCSRAQGNLGCNGGSNQNSFAYVLANNGIASDSLYPYKAIQQSCLYDGGTTTISGYVQWGGCTKMNTGIYGNPLTIYVDATNWAYYKSGVFSNCASTVNLSALLVGVVSGNWKVKNQWGTAWGQGGFIRLASGNTCGICNYAGLQVYGAKYEQKEK